MTEILVTGGTGALGSELVPRLLTGGYSVRVLSRRERPALPVGARAVRGDLLTGEGIADAVEGADIVVHCATGASDGGIRGTMYKPTIKSDVIPTKALLDVSKRSGIARFVFISIVGIDKIPLGYYRGKLDCERAIESSGVPFTILRATQFHSLAWEFGRRYTGLPIVFVPKGLRSQLVDQGEVADRMVSLINRGVEGLAPDMGGPVALDFADIIRGYLRATHKRRAVLQVTIPGKAMRGFREGHNLTLDHADGRITWDEWLAAHATS